MNDFNLSDKIYSYDGEDENGNPKMHRIIAGDTDEAWLRSEDVKEFIKRLKDDIDCRIAIHDIDDCDCCLNAYRQIAKVRNEKIDKLAGSKLIEIQEVKE